MEMSSDNNMNSDSDLHSTPVKKRKLVNHAQKFKSRYKTEWKCLSASKKGETYVFCNLKKKLQKTPH